MTSFRQYGFARVLVFISSLRPITRMSLFDEAIKCVQKPNKPRKVSKPGSQCDRAVVGWALTTHPGSFSATSESSTASGCSLLRKGIDSQEHCATSHAIGSTSLWGSYCCRRWGPHGFWGSGENGYLFSGSWGALVIIPGDLGSKLIILGIKGALPKSKRNKGKASILFDFLKISSAQTPLLNAVFIPFRTNMLIYIYLRENCAK